MATPLKIDNIDFSQLKFSKVRSKKGKRFINAFYDKKILQIVLPSLRIPFDARVSPYGALEFSLSLDKRENLIEKFKRLDEEMLKFAKANEWFENEDYRYIPVLKQSDNEAYPPTIKFKISKKDGEYVTRVFDEEKNQINIGNDSEIIELLKQNKKIISLIEFGGVWFSNLNGVESFGVFWKLVDMRIYPAPLKQNVLSEYVFEDSDSNIDEYAFDEE